MFEGFDLRYVETPEATIRTRIGGQGPPVLLLHGHPQTHVMWRHVAPLLAVDFTVVCADLRGYGKSSKPETTPDHEPYSKRAMARDMVAVMAHLGFERFCLAGHDRGSSVSYRLAFDHPEAVERLALLEGIPVAESWGRAGDRFMVEWWHWAFFAQPAPLAERLIGADPEWYLTRDPKRIAPWGEEGLADYLEAYMDPATRHAMFEDYRANASIDREHDEELIREGRRLPCPLLLLWGKHEDLEQLYGDPLQVWRDGWADDVRGRGLDAAHFLAEEAPEEVAAELRAFFLG